VTLTFESLNLKVERFMHVPRRQLVPILQQIGSVISTQQFQIVKYVHKTGNGRMDW